MYYGVGNLKRASLLKEYWCLAGDRLRGDLQIESA